jgi:hypothetical protein
VGQAPCCNSRHWQAGETLETAPNSALQSQVERPDQDDRGKGQHCSSSGPWSIPDTHSESLTTTRLTLTGHHWVMQCASCFSRWPAVMGHC